MKTAILALLLPSIAIAGSLDKPGGSTSSLNAPSARSSPYSPDQLAAAYEKNAIAANLKLKGQSITLSGIVDQIELDAIFFSPSNRATITDIKCFIDPAAAAGFAKLKTGAHVVITGVVDSMSYSQIHLTGCKVK